MLSPVEETHLTLGAQRHGAGIERRDRQQGSRDGAAGTAARRGRWQRRQRCERRWAAPRQRANLGILILCRAVSDLFHEAVDNAEAAQRDRDSEKQHRRTSLDDATKHVRELGLDERQRESHLAIHIRPGKLDFCLDCSDEREFHACQCHVLLELRVALRLVELGLRGGAEVFLHVVPHASEEVPCKPGAGRDRVGPRRRAGRGKSGGQEQRKVVWD